MGDGRQHRLPGRGPSPGFCPVLSADPRMVPVGVSLLVGRERARSRFFDRTFAGILSPLMYRPCDRYRRFRERAPNLGRTMRSRIAALLAALFVAVSALAGCGEGGEEEPAQEQQEEQEQIQEGGGGEEPQEEEGEE